MANAAGQESRLVIYFFRLNFLWKKNVYSAWKVNG